MIKLIMLVDDQGGGVMRFYSDAELSPTIRAKTNGHEPIIILDGDYDETDDSGRPVPRGH